MSEEWKDCTLGDVITLQRGFDLPERKRQPGNVPIVSSSGITGYHNIAKVSGPGVVTGRYGTLGEVFYIKRSFWPLNTTLYIRDFKGNHPLFISYFLRTLNLAHQNAAGAVPGLNRNALHLLPVRKPPFPIQCKIADILSAYDDLIENNTRRIVILEEMAQSLYQEWFVKFRFPGWEKMEMVETEMGIVPEGWEVMKVGNIVQRVPSGKYYDNKTVHPEGLTPVLDQGKSGIIGYHDNKPGVYADKASPIIVFANHTCYQRLIQFSFSTIQNVLPFTCNKEYNRDIYWLHWATKDLVKFNDYKGHWPEFIGKKLLLPPAEICSCFGENVKMLVQHAYLLNQKNNNLRRTRDLLLPRLISGNVDVASWVEGEMEGVEDQEGVKGRQEVAEPIDREGLVRHSLWE